MPSRCSTLPRTSVERDPDLADARGQEARDHEGDDEHGDHEAAPARHVLVSRRAGRQPRARASDGGTRAGSEAQQHAVVHVDDTPPLAGRCLGDPGHRQQPVDAADRLQAVAMSTRMTSGAALMSASLVMGRNPSTPSSAPASTAPIASIIASGPAPSPAIR